MAAVSKADTPARQQDLIKPEVIPVVEEPRMLPTAVGQD